MECPARAGGQGKLRQMPEEESHLFFQAPGNISPERRSRRSRDGGAQRRAGACGESFCLKLTRPAGDAFGLRASRELLFSESSKRLKRKCRSAVGQQHENRPHARSLEPENTRLNSAAADTAQRHKQLLTFPEWFRYSVGPTVCSTSEHGSLKNPAGTGERLV